MRIEVRQELLDPEMALIVGRCRCCGAEIYSRAVWEKLHGKCPVCARSARARRNMDTELHEKARQSFLQERRMKSEAAASGGRKL